MFAIIGWVFCLFIAMMAVFAGYTVLKIAFGFGSVNKGDFCLGGVLVIVGAATLAAMIWFAPFSISITSVS